MSPLLILFPLKRHLWQFSHFHIAYDKTMGRLQKALKIWRSNLQYLCEFQGPPGVAQFLQGFLKQHDLPYCWWDWVTVVISSKTCNFASYSYRNILNSSSPFCKWPLREMSTGLPICVMVGNVAMWKPKLFEFAELHLSLPAACAWGIWARWSCWTWVEMHLKNCLPVFLMDWTCQWSTWVTTSWVRWMLRSSTWRASLLWTCVETAWLTPRGRTWHASRWSSMWIEVLCSWKLMEIAFATWVDSDDLKFSPLQGGVEAATNSQVFSLQDSEQRLVAKVAHQLWR